MQEEYWNAVAHKKTFGHPCRMDWLLSHVEPDCHIVDVGCGYGRILGELYDAGFRNLKGLDTSAAMVERARREIPHVPVYKMEGFSTGLESESAGAVLLFAVLTSIPHNEDQMQLITECKRILRTDGVIYVSELLLGEDERNRNRYDQFEGRYGIRGVFELNDGGVMRHHEKRWIQQLLADLQTLEEVEIDVTTMNNHIANGYQVLARKFAAI